MKLRIGSVVAGIFLFFMCGCDNNIKGVKNLKDCEYEFKSITELNVSGMDLSTGVKENQILPLPALLIGSASTIPLEFTVNVEVFNPNSSHAGFEEMQYIIIIDNVEFTKGRLTDRFRVDAGKTEVLQVPVQLDVVTLFSENSQSATLNILKNFIGIGSEKSNVTVKLKPTINIEGIRITSPNYVTVNFSFGGN
jgi:LEA14-like dessication related protein